jgi:hypothetical protein
MARKKRVFDVGAVVREIARERIGQPKPTAVLVDKRRSKRRRETDREVREALRSS